jgi:hypothetical protein
MALGSGSVTVPSTSMASFFGKLSQVFLVAGRPDPPTDEPKPPPDGGGESV